MEKISLQAIRLNINGSFLNFRGGISGQIIIFFVCSLIVSISNADECHLTPVFHVLKYPGCIPKPIPSFACTGKCTSYVQVRYKRIIWNQIAESKKVY